jgi:hypothetical protein
VPTIVGLLLETVFCIRSVKSGHKEKKCGVIHEQFAPSYKIVHSYLALRVVGGDGKGSLESEAVKYGHESHGPRTRERLHWRGPAAIVNDRHVLSSERALDEEYKL